MPAEPKNYYKFFLIAACLHLGLIGFIVFNFNFSFTPAQLNAGQQIKVIQAHTVIDTTQTPVQVPAMPPTQPKLDKPEPKSEPEPKVETKEPSKLVVKKQVAFKSKKTVEEKPKSKPAPKVEKTPAKETPKIAHKQAVKPEPTQAERMAALAKKLQDQTRKNLQNQVKGEQQQLDQDLVQAQQTQGIVDKYKALILQQVGQNWIVPEVNKNISCRLAITLAPGGTVLDVKLVKSSGNAALDRSAIQAVYKASPLPVPKDSVAFNAMRELDMIVRPESAISKSSEK